MKRKALREDQVGTWEEVLWWDSWDIVEEVVRVECTNCGSEMEVAVLGPDYWCDECVEEEKAEQSVVSSQ